MSEDSRAAFVEAYKVYNWVDAETAGIAYDNNGPTRLMWNAAIAWASARQEARERRLIECVLDSDNAIDYVEGNVDRLLAAFNAAERERKG